MLTQKKIKISYPRTFLRNFTDGHYQSKSGNLNLERKYPLVLSLVVV